MEIIKDFIDADVEWERVKNLPWYYQQDAIGGEHDKVINSEDFIMGIPSLRCSLVNAGMPVREWAFDYMGDMLNKIINDFDCRVWSMHANLLLRNGDLAGKHTTPHVDLILENPKAKHYTGIIYLDNAGGTTQLMHQRYNGEPQTMTVEHEIEPEKGKLVYWEWDRYHSAPATGDDTRSTINVNWFVI